MASQIIPQLTDEQLAGAIAVMEELVNDSNYFGPQHRKLADLLIERGKRKAEAKRIVAVQHADGTLEVDPELDLQQTLDDASNRGGW